MHNFYLSLSFQEVASPPENPFMGGLTNDFYLPWITPICIWPVLVHPWLTSDLGTC
jgi:hypothetical protein